MKKRLVYFSMIIILLFAAAACVSDGQLEMAPSQVQDGGKIPVETEDALPATPSQAAPEATKEQAAGEDKIPTARIGLQATDPEIVSLASGEIQLVEFFAFW